MKKSNWKDVIRRINTIGFLFAVMLGCFILGCYATETFKYNKPVELYNWLSSVGFIVFFLILFINSYSKNPWKKH